MPETENKVRYGLSNVHMALATIGTDGSATFSTPVAVPGAVNVSLDADGSIEKFWADNIAYFSYNSEVGYSGDLEMAYFPKSILKTFFGMLEDANGMLYEDSDAEPPHFALMFQFEGDQKATRHILYNCTAAHLSLESQTTEGSNEPRTVTASINATPIYVPAVDKNVTKARIEKGDTNYNTFFGAVVQPAATATT